MRKKLDVRTTKIGKARLVPFKEVVAEWHKQPGYKKVYDALEEEFTMNRPRKPFKA